MVRSEALAKAIYGYRAENWTEHEAESKQQFAERLFITHDLGIKENNQLNLLSTLFSLSLALGEGNAQLVYSVEILNAIEDFTLWWKIFVLF